MEEFFENIWKMIVESNVLQLIGALLLLLVGWLVAGPPFQPYGSRPEKVRGRQKTVRLHPRGRE